MTSRDFAYWLMGYFEICDRDDGLTRSQVAMIKKHLALVFKHEIDPSFPPEQQDTLNEIHHGKNSHLSNHKPGPDGHLMRC